MSIIQTNCKDIGTFNGVPYVRLTGRFEGKTRAGEFAVPYEITTPKNPSQGNRTFVFEPPHFTVGPAAREAFFGAHFLFNRGFSHASVGYSNVRLRILDENLKPGYLVRIGGQPITKLVPFPCAEEKIPGCGEITDYEILKEKAGSWAWAIVCAGALLFPWAEYYLVSP